MSTTTGRVLCLGFTVLVASCGGGGSGGSRPPVSNPPPSPPPLQLTEVNAVPSAALVFDLLDHLSFVPEVPVVSIQQFVATGTKVGTLTCGGALPGITVSYDDNDGNNTPSAGDRFHAHYVCYGIDRTITMAITGVDLANGRIEGDVQHDGLTDQGMRITGSFRLSSSLIADGVEQTLTLLANTVSGSAGTVRITDATVERARTPTTYEYTLAGRVVNALGQEFMYDTPLPIAGQFTHVPSLGELVLSAGATRARIVPADDPDKRELYFDYQVNPGTGYGAPSTARWILLTSGVILAWDPNAPPQITSLTFDPAVPRAGEGVSVLVTAEDLDGDPLEYSGVWTVNGSMIGTAGTSLPPNSYEKGDILAFTAVVSDGSRTTTQTLSVTIANTPPYASAEIQPSPARTIDDLFLTASFRDDDGDSVVPRYEWLRNGELLAAETRQLLAHTLFEKGDVITGAVFASDGTDETRVEVSATIADTLPQIFAGSPPDAGSEGDLLTFQVSASDADPGDTLPGFVLTHGPAGMTVDHETGLVSWLVNGPAFDGEGMGFAWGVALDLPGGAAIGGQIWVTPSPGQQYPMLRVGLRAPSTFGLRAGDFDDDGDEEALVVGGGAIYALASDGNAGYRQSWAYPFALDYDPRVVAVAAGDVDADGRPEIFAATGDIIAKLGGEQRRRLGAVSVASVYDLALRQLEVADLDADGRPEVVAIETLGGSADPGTASRVWILRTDRMSLFRALGQLGPSDYGTSFAVGNVDHDADLEVVTNAGYVIDGPKLMNNDPQALQKLMPASASVAVGDTDADGVDEIVITASNGDVLVYAFDDAARSYEVVATIPNAATGAVLVADIGGSAAEEIVVGDGPLGGGQVKAYERAATPNGVAQVFAAASGGEGVTAIVAGDLDNDGAMELLWGVGADAERLVVAEADGTWRWTSTDTQPQMLTGPFTGGELSRSPIDAPAPLFATLTTATQGMRLFSMDPATGDFALGEELSRPSSAAAELRVVDYDKDLWDDAFIATDGPSGAYELAYDIHGMNTEFLSSAAPGEQSAVALGYADLNGDGRDDLVVASAEGWVRAFDVFNASPLFTFQTPGQLPAAMAVADVDGAGAPEIVVAGSERLTLFSRDGSGAYAPAFSTPAVYPDARDVVAADLDGDGAVEIFLLYGNASNVERFDASLNSLGGFQDSVPYSPDMQIEASAFERKNLLLHELGDAPTVFAIDPESGVEVWRSPRLFGRLSRGDIHFVDVEGNGRLHLSFATTLGVALTR